MNIAETRDHGTILSIVQQWPDEERVAFIQEILQTLIARNKVSPKKSATLQQALGIAKVASPPNDEEVQQWLDEHR